MTNKQIRQAQIELGCHEIQELIDTGMAWRMEGHVGRTAIAMLESGACMLPRSSYCDYYGNVIPPRQALKRGSKGTRENTVNFYTKIVL